VSTRASVPLSIYRGDSAHWRFTLYSDPALSTVYDLAGATATAQIRAAAGAPLMATLACSITLPNVIDVNLDAPSSAKLNPKGAWDLQLTYASGQVKTVVAGPVTVTADVTDPTRP
jgi:hypothetical protein